MSEPRICRRCVLSEKFPRIRLDEEGVCQVCRSAPDPEQRREQLREFQSEMDHVFSQHRGTRYDCLVAYSGGKDSSYTLLHLVREYKLRCLALTVDNSFLAPQALENARRVTSELEVDFLLFRPSPKFMHGMYRSSVSDDNLHAKAAIKRASAICSSCINLINTTAIIHALEKEIPVIAGGYIAGQVPKDAVVMTVNLESSERTRTVALERYRRHFGPRAFSYFEVDEGLRQRSSLKEIKVVNPLLALSVSEGTIEQELEQLGWRRPKSTGLNSSNCTLNDLGVYTHVRKHGFHPYLAEIAEQVRYGLMSREEGLRRAYTYPEAHQVASQAETIGISLS